MSFRISILKKEIRERIFSGPGRESRCTKVWKGERCLLLAPHDEDCVIAPPEAVLVRSDSPASKGPGK